jgi:GT2 family glycosyltransferase
MAMIGPVTNSAGNGQRLYDPSKSKQEWLELGAWLNSHPTGLLLPTYRCDFFCIAIRRDAWQALNGLDTIFGMGYFEDFDFSLRLREAGYEQAISEDVFIYHQGSATFNNNPLLKKLIKKNKKILLTKFKKINFIHARECNLMVIKHYLKTSNSILIEIRKKALNLDQPKSNLKKFIWHLKTRKFLLN